jgi:hypothetical protein
MRLRLIISLCILAVIVSGSVLAQEALSPPDQRAAFNAAFAKAQQGDVAGAIADWEALLPRSRDEVRLQVHFNLAAAYEMQGELPQAWFHLSTYLRLATKEDAEAKAALAVMEKTLAKGHGLVRISCDPGSAKVRFDGGGDREWECPLAWWFASGERRIAATAEGYVAGATTVTVAVGKTIDHGVKLELVRRGVLVVEGSGRAIQVFLNGALEGSVPFRRELKAGTYELMVGKPGEMPWKKMITVEAGKTVTERPEIAQPKVEKPKEDVVAENLPSGEVVAKAQRDLHLVEWSIMGTGLALAVGGAVFHGLAADRNDELTSKYPADPSQPATYYTNKDAYDEAFDDEVQPKLWAAYVLYAAGAAAIGTGATILLINLSDGKEAENHKLSLTPVLLPDAAGFTFGMSW